MRGSEELRKLRFTFYLYQRLKWLPSFQSGLQPSPLNLFTSQKGLSREFDAISRWQRQSTSIPKVFTLCTWCWKQNFELLRDRVLDRVVKILNYAGPFTKLQNTVVLKTSSAGTQKCADIVVYILSKRAIAYVVNVQIEASHSPTSKLPCLSELQIVLLRRSSPIILPWVQPMATGFPYCFRSGHW